MYNGIPETLSEAVEMAQALMKSDPENFKRGYTLENAAIAVAEVYGFDRERVQNELVKRNAEANETEIAWLKQTGRF